MEEGQEDQTTPTPEAKTSTPAPAQTPDELAKYRAMAERRGSQLNEAKEQLEELKAWKAEQERAAAEAAAKAGDTARLAELVNDQDAKLKAALAKLETYEAEKSARMARLAEQAEALRKALPPATVERWSKHLDGLDPERQLGILQDLQASAQQPDPGQPGGAPAAGGNGDPDGIADLPEHIKSMHPKERWPMLARRYKENLAKFCGGE